MGRQATQDTVDLSVDATADLTALVDDLRVANGTRVWVAAVGVTHGLWCLDKTSAATVDGVHVVATLSGAGRWIGSGAGLPQFGGIYLRDGAVVQQVNIAPSTLTGFAVDYPSSGGVAPDHVNDRVVVGVAGVYNVAVSISGSFPAARVLQVHVAVDGAPAAMAGIQRGASGGVVPSTGGGVHGYLTLAAGAVLTVQVSTDVDGQQLTLFDAALIAEKVG